MEFVLESSFIAEITSIIAIIISILLWFTTVRTLKEIRKQNENIERSIKSDTTNKITLAHQNIFFQLLNNEELLSIFISNSKKQIDFKRDMIATMLINHCSAIYSYSQNNLLTKCDWESMQYDIIDLFSWKVVKNRWPVIRKFYSKDFNDFVDSLKIYN